MPILLCSILANEIEPLFLWMPLKSILHYISCIFGSILITVCFAFTLVWLPFFIHTTLSSLLTCFGVAESCSEKVISYEFIISFVPIFNPFFLIFYVAFNPTEKIELLFIPKHCITVFSLLLCKSGFFFCFFFAISLPT